jgi:hypothetical protein
VSESVGAQANRPGRSYFVPAIRVAKLPRIDPPGTPPPEASLGDVQTETLLPVDVLYDIVRLEVTRVNTGISQYTITLNNWYAGVAADRKSWSSEKPAGDAAFQREQLVGDNPVWPRFKYNDFFQLKFGDRLRIDMRYWPDPVTGADAATPTAQNWVPMIEGPITDMRFDFATDQGAQVTVAGEDDLNLLKDKQEKRMEMGPLAELDLVKKVLGKANFPWKMASTTPVGYEAFVTDNEQGLQEALQAGQSYLDFIQKLADRLDFEVFLEFVDLVPTAPLEFHFEPWRSRAKPDPELAHIYRLHREANLLEFRPTINVVDQYSEVEVRGRHRDPLLAHEVKGSGTHKIIADELHQYHPDKRLLSGPEVRERLFRGRRNKFTIPNQSNMDDVRADWYAKVVIRRKARELFTVEGSTVGDPRFRPGHHVEIRGMGSPFDGFFYVTKTTHTYGADGLRTRFEASRSGMELPPPLDEESSGATP